MSDINVNRESEYIPFTLQQISYSLWTLHIVPATVNRTNAGCCEAFRRTFRIDGIVIGTSAAL